MWCSFIRSSLFPLALLSVLQWWSGSIHERLLCLTWFRADVSIYRSLRRPTLFFFHHSINSQSLSTPLSSLPKLRTLSPSSRVWDASYLRNAMRASSRGTVWSDVLMMVCSVLKHSLPTSCEHPTIFHRPTLSTPFIFLYFFLHSDDHPFNAREKPCLRETPAWPHPKYRRWQWNLENSSEYLQCRSYILISQ